MEEPSAAQREIAGYERELTSSIFCVFRCQSSSPLAERGARGLGAGEAACAHLVHELDVVLDYRHEQLLRLLRRRWSGGWVLMSGAAGGREGAPGWPSRRPRLLARARARLLVSPPKLRCSTRGCLCEVALPFASGSKSGWCEPFPLSHIASYFEARKKSQYSAPPGAAAAGTHLLLQLALALLHHILDRHRAAGGRPGAPRERVSESPPPSLSSPHSPPSRPALPAAEGPRARGARGRAAGKRRGAAGTRRGRLSPAKRPPGVPRARGREATHSLARGRWAKAPRRCRQQAELN